MIFALAGVGPLVLTAVEVPPGVSVDGATVLTVETPVFVTVMVTVNDWFVLRVAGMLIEELRTPPSCTLTLFDALDVDETAPPVLASVPAALPVKLTVPAAAPAV